MLTALDAVRNAGITIASDGAEFNQIGKFQPVDATTNPSLVLEAVFKPEYAHLVEEAVKYSQSRLPQGSVQEKTELALDRLLVQIGAEILAIVPGRVSISVDPRLSTWYSGILSKARALIRLVDELHIPRSRILVNIPATSEGIRAAQTLETTDGIHTNMTFVFTLTQALACAQAGVAVISPFIGRVKDWWSARRAVGEGEGDARGLPADQPLSEHPGILLVQRIREAYSRYGYSTQIMAAGFREPLEIVELAKAGSRGGADLVTLSPELLQGLMGMEGSDLQSVFTPSTTEGSTLPSAPPLYFGSNGPTEEGMSAFNEASREEAIPLDIVPEGLEKFNDDTAKLENAVRELVEMTTPPDATLEKGGPGVMMSFVTSCGRAR